jgi:hypothetical protein
MRRKRHTASVALVRLRVKAHCISCQIGTMMLHAKIYSPPQLRDALILLLRLLFKRFDPPLESLNSLHLSRIRLRQLFCKIHQPFEGDG